MSGSYQEAIGSGGALHDCTDSTPCPRRYTIACRCAQNTHTRPTLAVPLPVVPNGHVFTQDPWNRYRLPLHVTLWPRKTQQYSAYVRHCAVVPMRESKTQHTVDKIPLTTECRWAMASTGSHGSSGRSQQDTCTGCHWDPAGWCTRTAIGSSVHTTQCRTQSSTQAPQSSRCSTCHSTRTATRTRYGQRNTWQYNPDAKQEHKPAQRAVHMRTHTLESLHL